MLNSEFVVRSVEVILDGRNIFLLKNEVNRISNDTIVRFWINYDQINKFYKELVLDPFLDVDNIFSDKLILYFYVKILFYED
jgi:hypothetical protein